MVVPGGAVACLPQQRFWQYDAATDAPGAPQGLWFSFLGGAGLRGDAGELLGGCLPAEGLAGAGVEFGGDRGDPLGGVDAQVGALRVPLCLSSPGGVSFPSAWPVIVFRQLVDVNVVRPRGFRRRPGRPAAGTHCGRSTFTSPQLA